MTDNIDVQPGERPGKQSVATDEISAVHYPEYKIAYGAKGSVTYVDSSNPLPVIDQKALTITNAIDEVAYDLNAAAFSETTVITNDYQLSNILLNFSTTEVKTITVTGPDGTILWGGNVDTTASNLGYNTTKQHFNLDFNDIGFSDNDNITVAVTQFASAGTMDCIVKIKQGSDTLIGDPVVQGEDLILGGNYPLPLDRNGASVITIEAEHHRIHAGTGYNYSGRLANVAASAVNYFYMKTNGTGIHFRNFSIKSDSGPILVELFESPTVSVDGTQGTVYNRNRFSSNTSGATIFTGSTVTADGTLLFIDELYGANNQGGEIAGVPVEWMLSSSNNYLVKVTNNDGNNVNMVFNFFWYEIS